jgi:hypothetical protein
MSMMRTAALAAAVVAVALAAAEAHAYHGAGAFATSANEGGGSGNYFIGSRRFKGYDCTMCHVDPPGRIAVDLSSGQPELFTDGIYTAGATYRIHVTLRGQHLSGDNNTFLAEVVDDTGLSAGSYALVPDTKGVSLVDAGRIVNGHSFNEGFAPRTWSFDWRAPAAGSGPVTLHVGMVHGDLGGDDGVPPVVDPLGDDTVMVAARLCEGAGPCARPAIPALPDSAAQCHAGAGAVGEWGALLVALGLVARPRRRARCAAWALVGAVGLAGCFDPQAPKECEDFLCRDGAAVLPAHDAQHGGHPDSGAGGSPAVCDRWGQYRSECFGLPHGPDWQASCIDALADCGPAQLDELSACIAAEGCAYETCLGRFDCIQRGDGS